MYLRTRVHRYVQSTLRGVVLDTPSEGPDRLFVQIVTVFVEIVTKYTYR